MLNFLKYPSSRCFYTLLDQNRTISLNDNDYNNKLKLRKIQKVLLTMIFSTILPNRSIT